MCDFMAFFRVRDHRHPWPPCSVFVHALMTEGVPCWKHEGGIRLLRLTGEGRNPNHEWTEAPG